MRPIRDLLPVLALVALTSGCGSGGSLTDPPVEGLRISLASRSGDGQEGMTGRSLALPLRVLVTREGRPAAGVAIAWMTDAGVLAGEELTDADGIASARWTLPLAAGGSLGAWAILSADPSRLVAFRARASYPSLTRLGGEGQGGEVGTLLAAPLRVLVTWRDLPVVGDTLRFDDPGVRSVVAVTGADGVASAPWVLGPVAGERIVRARPLGTSSGRPQVTFPLHAAPGPVVLYQWSSSPPGAPPSLWGRLPLREQDYYLSSGLWVLDAYGNPVPRVNVGWRARWPDGDLTLPPSVADEDGLALIDVVLPGAQLTGDFILEASIEGRPLAEADYLAVDFLFRVGPWGADVAPTQQTVRAGTTVRWGNLSGSDHLLGPMDDPAIRLSFAANPRGVIEHRFDVPGTYTWRCHLHDPSSEGATTIVVVP